VSIPVLVKHDPGCKWSRFSGKVNERGEIIEGQVQPGHSDAAKRFSDWYNLHRAAGLDRGWFAVMLDDGASNGDVYDTRGEAVRHMWPNERWYFYCTLNAGPSMSVCAAESVLRWRRTMNEVEGPLLNPDAPDGGLEVIPRLTTEDQEAQIRAVRTGRGHLALGKRKR
jgi:hypothetical protein